MEKEKENNLKSKAVETYAADMTRAIDGSEGIYIKKIIEDQEQRETENLNLSPESKKNRSFMFISIFLLIVALSSLVAFAFLRKEISTVSPVPTFTPLIYLDGIEFMGIDGFSRDQIVQTIFNQSVKTTVKTGGVEGIYLTLNKQIIGLRNFLSFTSPDVDPKAMNFISDDFLVGVVNGENKSPFILIKVRSFSDVFDTMDAWENQMFNDLHVIFGVDLNINTKYLLTKDFEDTYVQNRNARILRDINGNIVMMYVYLDDTSIVITNSEAAAREIKLRLSSSTIKK